LLSVMAGVDADDKATADPERKAAADYTKALDANGLRGARIGVARNRFGFHDATDAVMAEALNALKRARATLGDVARLTHERVGDAESTVVLYELKSDLNAYLARLGPNAPVCSLREVIAFNELHMKEEMPYFGQDELVKAEAKGPLTSFEYLESLARCRRLT